MTLGSRQVAWFETYIFKERVTDGVGDRPVAGTPAWCELSDSDPRKAAALMDAGVHQCLRNDTQQEQLAEVSRAISASADWPSIAKEAHNLEQFYANRPWLKRAVS